MVDRLGDWVMAMVPGEGVGGGWPDRLGWDTE